ncbi:glycosyltransferase [Rubripirellula reticaptiva]|nr:glycosyltransferase [Rubripirellula reticaptiva]
MNITCLIHSLDGGGAERVMAGLSSRLAGRGHAVTLLTLDRGESDRHLVDPSVSRRMLGVMGETRSLISAVANLRRRVRVIRAAMVDSSPDVVLSFCDRTNILAVMAARPTGIPIVISERSDPSAQSLGRAYGWLRNRMYPKANRIIAQTVDSAEYIETLLISAGRRRVTGPVDVIPSAVDTPCATSDRSVAVANRQVVSVGRLEIEKGFDRLIDAFAPVVKRYPDWKLQIIGEGSQRGPLENQIRQLGLTSSVSLAGWIQPVWQPLAAATIFVSSSHYEGFPSALMEAMAAGVPSVSVDCPSGPRQIICDTLNGLLVPNDLAGITAGIERMIVDSTMREEIGEAGRDVLTHFGWPTMVDHYERVLAEESGR